MKQPVVSTPSEQPDDVPGVEAPAARELAGRLAGLSLPRQVLALAVWPFFEQLLNFLVGFVDTVLAGHLPIQAERVPATNAVGVAGYIGWLLGITQMAVGIGATAVIARAVGGRHRRVAHAALGQSLLMAVVFGTVIGGAVFLLAPGIGRFAGLRAGHAELAMAVDYLRIIAAAGPLHALLFVGAACLRGAGDTRTPFAVMVVVNVVNTGASVLFVFAPAPLGGHGVAGIAAGTALAWAVGSVIILAALVGGWGGIRLHVHRLRPHAHTMKRILRVGVPSLFESSGQWVANFLVLGIIGRAAIQLGQVGAQGAHMVAVRIEALSYLPGVAMGTAAATLVGQYLGLGDPGRARAAARLCWAIAAGLMCVTGLVFIVAPEPLVRLANEEPAILGVAPQLLRICGYVQVLFATYIVLSHALRGAGDTRATMILTFASVFGVRLPLAYLFGVTLGGGLVGVWYALCGELVVRGLIFAWRFFHGGWARVAV